MKTTILTMLATLTLASATTITTTGSITTSTYKPGSPLDRHRDSSSATAFNSSVTSTQPGVGGGWASLEYAATESGFTMDGAFIAGYVTIATGDSYSAVGFSYSFEIDEPHNYSLWTSSALGSARAGSAGWWNPSDIPIGIGVIDPGIYTFLVQGSGRGYSDPDYSQTGWGSGDFHAVFSLSPVGVPDVGSTGLMLAFGMLGLLALKAKRPGRQTV